MPRIILIGLPGSGKSTVARALSRITGLSVSDSDHMIEEESGRKISSIFAEEGESVFRMLEAQVVRRAIALEPGILSLGGGSILDPESCSLITGCGAAVIYLEISISQASARVGKNEDRPLLQGDPGLKLEAIAAQRAPIYESLATLTIRTDSKKASEVADEILSAINVERV